MNNLKLFGTTHLDSKESIIEIIKKEKPDVIGIELCKIREYIYLNNIKPQETKDETLLSKISNAIKKKAKEENVVYGSDMFTALQYSIDNKIPYVLIDKNIQEVQTLFQKIPQKESQNFLTEIAKFEKQTIAENTIDEQVFLNKLKLDYPISYEILITIREQHIALEIFKMLEKYKDKKILIFLGKGHLNGIKRLLE